GSSDAAPAPLAVQVGDVGGGGMQSAIAILGALLEVERGAEGRWLDVSMTDGAVSWLALAFAQMGAGEEVRRGAQRLSGQYACYQPVLDLNEVAAHEQVAARRLIERRPTGVEVRPAVPMSDRWRRLDPPRLGEHTAEVLAEVGVDGTMLDALRAVGVV